MEAFILTSGAGDWIGLYSPDGKLLTEGHSIDLKYALQLLGFRITSVEGSEYLEEYGSRCPATWEEVIK